MPPPSNGASRRSCAKPTPWLNHAIKAMREGEAQEAAIEAANQAVLGYRQRCVVRWPNVPYWDDIEFVQLADGSWEKASKVPSVPDCPTLRSDARAALIGVAARSSCCAGRSGLRTSAIAAAVP
jgi:hypothetical protein